jgi:polar amino acid transport system substrate-binding protein
MQDNMTVFVLKGKEFSLTQLSDLKSKRGSVPSGWSLGDAFDQYAKENLQLEQAQDNAAIFKKLLAGYSDYAISAYWDGTAYLQQEKLMDKIVPLSYTIATNNVHLMVSRRSPCQNQVTQINQLLKKYQQEGVIEAMLEGYRTK